MRPRKPIVLLMDSEIDLSLWRLRLDAYKYHVLSALTLQDALAHLATNAACYQVVTDCTCNADLRQLQRRAGVKVLVIDTHHSLHGDLEATAFEPKGPALPARVLDRLRILMVRKRGPLKKQVTRVLGVTVDTTQPTHQEATAA